MRAGDLGFSVEEAAVFLGEGMGLQLADAEVATLVDRTEGWVAGLQLAGLALRDRPDPAGFVAAFAGGHRLVADYLLAEVLDRQPPSTRRFLLTTGVLDRLCARCATPCWLPTPATARRSWRSWSGPTCSWCP